MLTVNGAPVLAMRLTLPLSGVWVASIQADRDAEINGGATIKQAGISYAGHVVRSGVVAGTCHLDVIGGAGGLTADVGARSYRGVEARTVLAETLAAAGEALDAGSSRSALDTLLPFWTRAAARTSLAISQLAEAVGAVWRVNAAGAVWFGLDAWPGYTGRELFEIERDPASQTVVLAPEDISLMPGVTVRGERVGRVEHLITDDAPLRTTFWVEV